MEFTSNPKMAKAAPKKMHEHRLPPATITLDRYKLQEAGVDLQVDNDNLVHLVPVGIYSEEKLEAGRAFAEALGLDSAGEEEMFQAVESIAMWAAVRRSSR